MTVTGVRWAESNNRRKTHGIVDVHSTSDEDAPDYFESNGRGSQILNNDNNEAREFLESCYRLKKTVINPIIDWEDEDVWEFIHKYNLPYCELYDQGFKRLGCIGCPLGGAKSMYKEFERYPKYKNAYLLAFKKMIDTRIKKGNGVDKKWATPEAVMEWWLGFDERKNSPIIDGQIEIEL